MYVFVLTNCDSIFILLFTSVVTIGRAYVDHADCAHYKLLFDKVQFIVQKLMGRRIQFKQLSPGGNILAINVDLEAAQVLGAVDSFLPTNEPEYSGITTNDPAVLVEYFIKAYHTHIKRYVTFFMTQRLHINLVVGQF
jgi:hypothetical protein